MLLTLSNGGQLAIMPAPGTPDTFTRLQRSLTTDPMVRACALVFESWATNRTDIPPSEDPERGEAILVSIMTAGRQGISVSPIERPANTVRKGPFKWIDESGGEITGRFIRPAKAPQ